MKINFSNPIIKGIITGSVMVVAAILLSTYGNELKISLHQNIIYGLFTIGIVWTIIEAIKENSGYTNFSFLFSQAFKCFIVITLLMVVFSIVFLKLHPEYAMNVADMYKTELIKQGQKTPDEIEKIVVQYQKQYATIYISTAIFGYLIYAAIISSVIILFFKLFRRK